MQELQNTILFVLKWGSLLSVLCFWVFKILKMYFNWKIREASRRWIVASESIQSVLQNLVAFFLEDTSSKKKKEATE